MTVDKTTTIAIFSVIAILSSTIIVEEAFATNTTARFWVDETQTYVCTTDLTTDLDATANVSICTDTATSEARWEGNPGSDWTLSTSGSGNDSNLTADDLSAGVLGKTNYWYNGMNEFTDANIQFNENESFGDALDGDSSEFDYQSVATHEFGHLAGLTHTTNTSSVLYSTLTAGDDNREPTSHDFDHMDDKY